MSRVCGKTEFDIFCILEKIAGMFLSSDSFRKLARGASAGGARLFAHRHHVRGVSRIRLI